MKTATHPSIIKKIDFHSDGFKLNGFLHLPPSQRPPVVIGSHGLYSNSRSPKQIELANRCNSYNLAYFRFDHRGCGDSEGRFEDVTSLEARCRDLTDAVGAIFRLNHTDRRVGLFGSSMGGTVCLTVAERVGAEVLVTYAAPIRNRIPPEESPAVTTDVPEIFLDTRRRSFDISAGLHNIKNILIVHGDADTVVPITHARAIYDAAAQPKKLVELKRGDHPMSDPANQKIFIKEASRWLANGLNG